MSGVPAEHRIILPNGEKALTEQGMIHFATIVEQLHPGDAERVRQIRYALQKRFQEVRKQP